MKRFRVYYRWPGDAVESYFTIYAQNEQDAHERFLRDILSPEEAQRVIVTRITLAPRD